MKHRHVYLRNALYGDVSSYNVHAELLVLNVKVRIRSFNVADCCHLDHVDRLKLEMRPYSHPLFEVMSRTCRLHLTLSGR